MYFIAKTFTPILNTKDFQSTFGGKDGLEISIDNQGFIRALESIAFPKTKFKIVKKHPSHILEVATKDYPYPGPFFVDSRFLLEIADNHPERIPKLPSSCSILQTLDSLLGHRYFWGGNCLGIEEILSLYPPQKQATDISLLNWQLKGFDCSGLMYYASNGFTPRNTSSWCNFGNPVFIEGKKVEEITELLKPLDAILWKGHIIFVHDKEYVIESKSGEGVIKTNIKQRLQNLMDIEGKKPKNNWEESLEPQFLIRTWHPEFT